jgi:hypothetical protein
MGEFEPIAKRWRKAKMPSPDGVPMQGGGFVTLPQERRGILRRQIPRVYSGLLEHKPRSRMSTRDRANVVVNVAVAAATALSSLAAVEIPHLLANQSNLGNGTVLNISEAGGPTANYPYYPSYAVDSTGEKPFPGTPCKYVPWFEGYVCKTSRGEGSVVADGTHAVTGMDNTGNYGGGVAPSTGPSPHGQTLIFGLETGQQMEAIVNEQGRVVKVILLKKPLPETIFTS